MRNHLDIIYLWSIVDNREQMMYYNRQCGEPLMSEYEILIGKTVLEAALVFPEITIRTMESNGKGLRGTCDFLKSRLNVATVDGKIVRIMGIG